MILQRERVETNKDISVMKRKALEKLMKGSLKTQTISRIKKDAPVALSCAQRRIWFLEQLMPGSIAYNMPFAVKLRGNLNVKVLKETVNYIVGRHETLRTTFPTVESEPVQFVQDELVVEIQETGVEGESLKEKYTNAFELARTESAKPFRLGSDQLIRFMLIRIADEENLLFINMHHIISDGWSCGIFVKEFSSIYKSLAAGKEPDLKPLPIQYRDYTCWQEEWLKSKAVEQQLSYWREKLGGGLTTLDIPKDNPPPAVAANKGDRVYFKVSNLIKDRLKQYAKDMGVTPYMILLSIYYILLYRYSNQDDIIVGTPVANRRRPEVENLIGVFVNTLALRADLSGNPAYSDFLKKISRVAIDAFNNQDIPFEWLVDDLKLERNLSKSPVFQTMFVFQNSNMPQIDLDGLSVEIQYIHNNTAKFDLLLTMYEENEGLSGAFEYSCDTLSAKTVERMSRHFVNLLEAALCDPSCSIGTLPLMPESEMDSIVYGLNRTHTDYRNEVCLNKLFEQQVEKTPDSIAVSYGDRVLTYTELNRRVNQLARYLRNKGVGPDVLVGVFMERSIEMVLALYGIIKAGGAYVPLDPDYPSQRIQFMMEDADTSILLAQKRLVERLPENTSEVICLDAVWSEIDCENGENLETVVTGDNLAYMIFTSGSTGRPKGVMNIHRAICNRLVWMQNEYRLGEDDKVMQKTPFSFDVSVWEFFWPLMTGASLVVARPGGHKDSAYLVDTIKKHGITTLHFVPSMLQIFLQEKNVGECTSLRRVICSGEALTFQLRERFFQKMSCQLHNLYGPTEAAVDVTYWDCSRDNGKNIIPIGYPIANIKIHILDRFLQPVPVGVPGELHIGGIGLARGYHKRPELTKEKFIKDPFDSTPEARLYKTGDLARYMPDGSIEYLGRIDFQVKLRGQRIELGEIEAVLEQAPSVREAVVTVYGENEDDQRLIAYLVTDMGDGQGDESYLKEALRDKLPEYMIPNDFVFLKEMPLSPNGKADRKALRPPEKRQRKVNSIFIAPRTSMELEMSEIFASVLGINTVGVTDSFFELGGHSLLATKLIFKIQERFHIEYTVRTFFEKPTVEGVVQTVEKMMGGQLSAGNGNDVDLEKEVCLDSEIIRFAKGLQDKEDSGSILLTGATGFLGSFLLDTLLKRTSSDIYCLVRAGNADDARERISKSMRDYGMSGELDERVKPLTGDLEKPLLGLDEKLFGELASKLDSIYHNGAFVNFVYPYNTLKAANVNGTAEVLRMASLVKRKPVNYISTLHVFSSEDYGQYGPPGEQHMPTHCSALKLGYAQSKWVAERITGIAQKAGIPVRIFRVGRISGHSSTGACQSNDFLWRMIKSCIQMGMVPKVNMPVDIAPVDFIAEAIVGLSQSKDIKDNVFHLFNTRPSSLCSMLEWMRKYGYTINSVSYNDWYKALLSGGERMENNAAFSLIPFLKELSGAENTAPSFDCTRTNELLSSKKIECPAVNENMFETYFSYFINSGFIEAPQGGEKK